LKIVIFLFILLFIVNSGFSQKENAYDKAIYQNQLGDSIFNASDYKQSLVYYQQAYDLVHNSDSVSLISDILNNLGVANDYLGEYDDAIVFYNEAIKLNTLHDNKAGLAMTINNIGALYFFWGKYDLALDNYLEALKYDIELGNIQSEAGSYENIAIIYKNKKEYKKAAEYYDKALKINQKLGLKNSIGRTYNNIGNLYLDQKDYRKAIEYTQMALDIQIILNAQEGMIYSYNNLGTCYAELKDYDKAELYFQNALELALKHHFTIQVLFSQKSLANLYDKIENYKSANKYLSDYYELKDSVFTEAKHQQMMELEQKFEAEKKGREIEALGAQSAKQQLEIEAKSSEKNMWIGISVLGFVLVLIFIYYYLNKKKLSEKLSEKNALIEKTSGEKDVLLREIHHRVKNNLQIITSLLNMQSRFLDDKKSKAIVEESKDRIKSMSLIHQKLYQEDNLTGIESESYFTELIESLCQTYGLSESKATRSIKIENLLLDVDTAIPLGLIINEMVSNAFKYGVDKENGEFVFEFGHNTSNELQIIIKDNGPGIPDGFDISKSKSYGMKLIQSLSKKLKAEVDFKNDNGLEIKMIIRRYKLAN
jgi:two-component sensor histidine kinase